jgi:hypothetical protein
MRSDAVELLLVRPVGPLGPLVGAVADRGGLRRERGARVVGVEDELDHLPVALVGVVEVVERVEEPVLQRDLPRVSRLGDDVRVDDGLAALRQAAGPQLVRAAGVEGVPREVEVVLVQPREVLGARADLHQVERVPGTAERDRRITEEHVDVRRDVRLARPAFLGLLDEADDGCVLLGERRLVGEIGGRRRRGDERDGCGKRDEEGPRSHVGRFCQALRGGRLARFWRRLAREQRAAAQTGRDAL